MIYLDTHAAIWLHAGEVSLFSAEALASVEAEDLFISPIVLLELEYLHEIKRIRLTAKRIVTDLEKEIGLCICELPFPEVCLAALAERWTRDPFDRIITAQARRQGAPLLSRDEDILKHYPSAFC